MPSPFPGMDPYLEGSLWTTFHFSFAAEILRQLASKVPPRYLVLAERRFVIEAQDAVSITTASVYPDVSVADSEIREPAAAYDATASAPLHIATVMPEPVPQHSIEIRDAAERRLVTAIEILSPTNKRGDGRDEYLARRQRLLRGTAHLIEIDLLRHGDFVFLSRAEARPLTEVWPIAIDYAKPPEVPLAEREARWTAKNLGF